MEKLLNSLKALATFLLGHFDKLIHELIKHKKGLTLREATSDFFSVLFSTGFFGLLNLIALFVFTSLPQGKDVLLIIVEEIGVEHRFANLVGLIIGIVLWSAISEFGARYSIYVTDNSGKSLSADRVNFRKVIQKIIASLYLLLPFVIVMTGFAINYFQDESLSEQQKYIGFGVPFACLYFVLNTVAHFYFDENKRAQLRKSQSGFARFMLLPQRELDWCNKLYGIYNDYVFTIRKPSNFVNLPRNLMNMFWKATTNKEGFPQDATQVHQVTLVPGEFKLLPNGYTKEPGKPEGLFRWRYRIPLSFYKKLHAQLLVIVSLSCIFFGIICMLGVPQYAMLGAPALIAIAFACYCGIYIGILYVDFALMRKSQVSLRFILLTVLLLCSYFNTDHPVRSNCCAPTDSRPSLQHHFNQWFANYKADSLHTLYKFKDDSANAPSYPVLFVCAEGGALRTGAFAALTLSFLQDSLASHYDSVNFSRSIYAYSGVSGGSLGVAFFNAITTLSEPDEFRYERLDTLAHVFFNKDFLAPVIGKMFYGEFINLFMPRRIERFDRAIALEESWEAGFQSIIRNGYRNVFSSEYTSLYKDSGREYCKTLSYPALFINTTEVESGFQCWLSNVRVESPVPFSRERDLFRVNNLKGQINYSTAINFSTRFPLFSPAACIQENIVRKRHYVDGGYVENTGSGTMLEILQALKPQLDSMRIRPYVLLLRYNDNTNAPATNINFGNELQEIVAGLYNTRSGRSNIAMVQLSQFLESTRYKGKLAVLPLNKTGSQVPMNWTLSEKSISNIKDAIKTTWNLRTKNELSKLFYFDTCNCIMYKNWVIRPDTMTGTTTAETAEALLQPRPAASQKLNRGRGRR